MKTNNKLLFLLLLAIFTTNVARASDSDYHFYPIEKVSINKGEVLKISIRDIFIASGQKICHVIGDENILNYMGVDYEDYDVDKIARFIGVKEGKTTVCISTSFGSQTIKAKVWEVTVLGDEPTSLILQKNLHLEVGTSQTLSVAFYPSGTSSDVTWFSTNPNVVSVNDGKLTSKAVGEATITCITANGLREDCNVVVSPKLAQSITMNTNHLNMNIGDEYQFATTITPEANTQKQVVWRSLNPNVANVDANGLAQCTGNGWTLVTATTTDGTYLTAGCFIQAGEGVSGDLNDDGLINISDIVMLINAVLHNG